MKAASEARLVELRSAQGATSRGGLRPEPRLDKGLLTILRVADEAARSSTIMGHEIQSTIRGR